MGGGAAGSKKAADGRPFLALGQVLGAPLHPGLSPWAQQCWEETFPRSPALWPCWGLTSLLPLKYTNLPFTRLPRLQALSSVQKAAVTF